MPVRRQPRRITGVTSYTWPSGGRHLWPSGETSAAQSHARGHLVYAASGVLAVHTERGTSIVPANRVAWTPAGFTHRHRAHGDTDMRIVFLTPSLARLIPDHPAVFLASGLAREVLLALTGPGDHDAAAPDYSRSARTRLLRVLVDELREAHEQPLHLPEPRDDRLRAIARTLYENPADNASLAELGRTIGAGTRTLSRLFRDELGMTFYEWRTHPPRARAPRRRPRHHPHRPRLRMGQSQRLHRGVHRHHRNDPGPLPNQSPDRRPPAGRPLGRVNGCARRGRERPHAHRGPPYRLSEFPRPIGPRRRARTASRSEVRRSEVRRIARL